MKSPRIRTLEDLVELCKESGKEDIEISLGARAELQLYLNTYTFLKLQIEELDQSILEEARKSIKSFEYIEEIDAISKTGVISIIAELGGVENFKTSKQVLNFAGLNLKEKSSGLHKGRTKISKSGSRHIRKHIYTIAQVLIVRNDDFRVLHCYYKSHKRENKSQKMEMLIATCCKILKKIFGILKNNKPFDRSELFKSIDFSKCDMNEFNKEYQGNRANREIIDLEEFI